jgi:hypothetical protein
MGCKKPGRVKLICIKCEDEFKTHSSNRRMCHKCLPKCKERHYFYAKPQKKEEKDVKVEEKAGKVEENIEQDFQS